MKMKIQLVGLKICKLEMIYRGELYAEILQIIHRKALRKIKDKTPIHIYIAFDDSKGDSHLRDSQPLVYELNDWYFKNCNYTWNQLHDDSLYGLEDKLKVFADDISKWISKNITYFNKLPLPLSKIDEGKDGIDEKFRNWLKRNWNGNEELINKKFADLGFRFMKKKIIVTALNILRQ
jgi:flavodoxin